MKPLPRPAVSRVRGSLRRGAGTSRPAAATAAGVRENSQSRACAAGESWWFTRAWAASRRGVAAVTAQASIHDSAPPSGRTNVAAGAWRAKADAAPIASTSASGANAAAGFVENPFTCGSAFRSSERAAARSPASSELMSAPPAASAAATASVRPDSSTTPRLEYRGRSAKKSSHDAGAPVTVSAR